MTTFCWLIIGITCTGAGMLYSHKNKLHKIWAVILFALAALGSVVLGVKAIADGNTPTPVSSVDISSNSAPVLNAPNNSGNINTGPVGGNLTQISGLVPRKLTDAQIADLKDAVRFFLDDGPVAINGMMGDQESLDLCQQLTDVFGLKPNEYSQSVMAGTPKGIAIEVRSANPPPPIATALVIHLRKAGFQDVGILPRPEWPPENENKVVVNVFFDPSQNSSP